jgi:hypothetical protein
MTDPSRDDVRRWLRDLIRETVSREEAADWASQYVRAADPGIEDEVVWRALVALAGADLKVSPDEYLHQDVDFRSWLDEVELANDSYKESGA